MLFSNGVVGDKFPDTSDGECVKAALTGKLWKIAGPIVQHYHSDVYRDVHWIDKYVDGEAAFYFGIRDTGTSIGTARDEVAYSNAYLYRVEVTNERPGTWYVTITGEAV